MKLLLISLALVMTDVAYAQTDYKSEVWSPDNGDGTYTNPVINADYSDPDVCVGASGEDYYLTASKVMKKWKNISAHHNMVLGYGHHPSATMMVGTISIGVTPTLACIW